MIELLFYYNDTGRKREKDGAEVEEAAAGAFVRPGGFG
jgi:hypothetical protein